MAKKPTYEELEQRVKELEKEAKKRKRTEEAQRDSEERYKILVDGGLFGVIIHDDDAFLITEQAAEMWGYDSPEEMTEAMQGDIENVFAPEYREGMKEKRALRYQTKETSTVEMEGLRKDGSRFPIMVSISVIPWKEAPLEMAIQCSYLDLTEINMIRKKSEEALLKAHSELELRVEERTAELAKTNEQLEEEIEERDRAEEALRESKENLDKAQKLAHIGNWSRDLNFNIAQWSDELYRIFGLTPGDPAQPSFETFLSRVHPGDRDRVTSVLKEAAEKKQVFDFEFRTIPIEGSERILRNRGGVEYDETGDPVRLFGATQNITERKRAEENREKEFHMRTILLDNIPGCIALILKKGTREIVASNRFARELGAVPGQTCFKTCAMRDDNCPFCLAPKLWTTDQMQTLEVEYRGEWYEGIWAPLSEDLYVHYIFVITDRIQAEEEKMRIEDRLQQVQKIEAISTLAGGIAHNFNNALTPIIGNVDLLEMAHGNDENTMKSLKDMKTSGLRMAHLTSQLLAYARGGKYNPEILSLSDFVDATLPLIQHTLDSAERVETDLPLDLMNVKADDTQMQMVLSAIMANSNEAMEGPGRIRISTRNIDLDQESIKDHPGLKQGPYVCLSIEDDGKGMDEETKSKIFDPFFTTHFMGRGLGMASVYGVIKNHDGAITVDSEPGKGTVVRIYLPAIVAEEKPKIEVVSKPEIELPKGDATILVIEDEEQIMMLIRQVLERLGYRVLEAETGKEAIRLAQTFDGQIDLALLDIKLPDMSGDRVYPIIMEARPDLKVIVCSGYGIEGPPQDVLNAGAEGFIQKPFSIAPFAEKLKQVLERK